MTNISAIDAACNTNSRVMRRDAQERQDRLCAIILAAINSEPQYLDGQIWAGPFSHDEWAQRADLNVRTFRRLIAAAPFVSEVRGSGGNKRTYLRLGIPAPNNRRKVQNTMAKIWREHRRVTWLDPASGEFGCICGMAQDLPEGWQVKVFEHALRHWGAFMAYTKLEIEAARIEGAAAGDVAFIDHTLETARLFPAVRFRIRYYRYPCVKYLRRFGHVAVTLYADHLQDMGKTVPAELSGNIYLPPVSPVEIPY